MENPVIHVISPQQNPDCCTSTKQQDTSYELRASQAEAKIAIRPSTFYPVALENNCKL